MRAWRTAHASAAGTSHTRAGAPCQDAARCDVVQAAGGCEVLIASVADGAGSAAESGRGARIAVEAFYRAFAEPARQQPDLAFFDEARARSWLAALQAELAAEAEAGGLASRDYACTFLGAVVGPDAARFLQIGDGAIVVAHPASGGHRWVFWPQHGEFANSTFFVTMAEAAELLAFTRYDGPVQELALFSDGLERLILDMRTRDVHSPSLRPILAWLAATPAPADAQPSAVLASYLNSPNVNRRTDDDKTLVVATRRPPEAAG